MDTLEESGRQKKHQALVEIKEAADCGLTTEDCGPTAIANRRLIADWETNFGLRTYYGVRTTYKLRGCPPVVRRS
jgi:hypothetical protein